MVASHHGVFLRGDKWCPYGEAPFGQGEWPRRCKRAPYVRQAHSISDGMRFPTVSTTEETTMTSNSNDKTGGQSGRQPSGSQQSGTGMRGGTPEQRGEAGRQSHKHDDKS